MNPWWIALAVALAAVFGLYLSMTAGRLDRLHKRIDTSRLALDAQLLRRSAVALEVAASGLLDPATSALVADAAHTARTAPEDDPVAKGLAESDLTKALGAAFADREDVDGLRAVPEGAALVDELDGACMRVELSRRFLNDAVRACRQVRRQRLPRWFGLAGRTPWPDTVEMDDTPPAGLRIR
jgi:hypothetical protein